MNHLFCPVGKTQYHVMVLAAVKPGAEQLHAVKERPGKDAEMTDIIVGAEVVNGIVRLEMHGKHLIDIAAFIGGLVTVYVIGPLFIDSPRILI